VSAANCKQCGTLFAPDWGSGLCFEWGEALDRARSGEGWQDASRDAWGRQRAESVHWKGGNCLKACIATMLGTREIMGVPDPTIEYCERDDWLGPYNDRLSKACGVRLESHEPRACPPRGRGLWIAGIELEGELFSHAVVCREHFVWHDPGGFVRGQLDLRSLVKGFTLARTQLLVPNFSLGRALAVAR
jgi:hypothetical protein